MVAIVKLPDAADGSKQGVDDFLGAGGTLEDLLSLSVSYDKHSFTVEEWPVLAEEAYHGPAGEVVRAVEDNTESDPVALLLEFKSRFGSAIGRGAHFRVEGDRHFLKLNYISVGKTSKGRKGTAAGRVNVLLSQIDANWTENCIESGLSSGEGLIHRVRDKVERKNQKTGETEVVDAGVSDKRLFVEEPEFSSPLTVMSREGNTLSMVIRNAWDDKPLSNLTKKDGGETATHSHITISGHITTTDLHKHLSESKLGGGIANRFLFALVKRSKVLPKGGAQDVFSEDLLGTLRESLAFGREEREIDLSEDMEEEYGYSADELWCDIYEDLSEGEPFLIGSVISRAEAQVRRLATLYAVLDRSREVQVAHLLAALAVWQYCEDSARILFGQKAGDRKADAILDALRDAGGEGLMRTELYELLDRHVTSRELTSLLKELEGAGWIFCTKEDTGKPGPRPERWFIVGGDI
jgi:hypothetical protein